MKRELRGKKSRKQRETAENPKMGQDLFTYLPSEMIMNILSRLPIQSIIRCKCVCKSWLDLLAKPEFMKFHLSKSVAGLAVFLHACHPKRYRFFEFIDELNLIRRVSCWNMVSVFNFNVPCAQPLHSSANGLLFLCNQGARWYHDLYRLQLDGILWPRNLFICNPITRDYIMIPCPRESSFSKFQLQLDTYGFGVSRMSGKFKLVRIFHEWILGTRVPVKFAESECQVYTVGTGSWRRIGSGGRPLLYIEGNDIGVFLNGNLHWLAREMEGSSLWISCFDLETELFSTFLLLILTEYADDKSWTKEFIITKRSPVGYNVRPIKVFENGGILMAECTTLLYFTSKTKSIRKFDVFGLDGDFNIRAIMYTSSFVPLKTFAMENVTSF